MLLIGEANRAYEPELSERELARLWEGLRFPPQALTTIGGDTLNVVYRGLPGRGPGPDFRAAVIAAPWGTLRGDVELHVRASDFRRHGHHTDPAYNRLALHLVYRADEPGDTLLASGRTVPVAALGPWVERRAGEVQRWLERPALWREPCRCAVDRYGAQAVAGTLDRLGDIRFRLRTRDLRRELSRWQADEVLFRALLEALGYGGNREPMRLLALRLPWRELCAALKALPPVDRPAAALTMLERAAGAPPALTWRRAGVRPGNRPRMRLEAAARLAARYAVTGLSCGIARDIGDSDAAAAVSPLTLKTGARTLAGTSRAVEMLTNAVLPLLAAARMEPRSGWALSLYRGLPRPARYGPVRHLDEAIAGGPKVDARRQQGMLFLLRRYCTQGRCGSCPLS